MISIDNSYLLSFNINDRMYLTVVQMDPGEMIYGELENVTFIAK